MSRPMVQVHCPETNNVHVMYPIGPYLQLGDFVTADGFGNVTKATKGRWQLDMFGVVTSTEYPEDCLIVWNEKAV